ncbi:MAG TPA: hypothetical protein VF457_15710 [Burkholderiaceae bacterium]
MTNAAGSRRARAVDILRAEACWLSASALRERLGFRASLSATLAPALRDGELWTQELEGRRYYRARGARDAHPPLGPADPPAAPRRFQLQPVWPPGFVPRLADPLPKDTRA